MEALALQLVSILKKGGWVFLCGNGGAASDAAHFAAELYDYRVEALTTNLATITAIGNDFGFEYIFSKQLAGRLTEKDAVILLSTSGKSENILQAAKLTQYKRATILAFCRQDSPLAQASTLLKLYPSYWSASHVQDQWLRDLHQLADLIKEELSATPS